MLNSSGSNRINVHEQTSYFTSSDSFFKHYSKTGSLPEPGNELLNHGTQKRSYWDNRSAIQTLLPIEGKIVPAHSLEVHDLDVGEQSFIKIVIIILLAGKELYPYPVDEMDAVWGRVFLRARELVQCFLVVTYLPGSLFP